MDLKNQINSAESLANNLELIRKWLDQNPEISPETAAAMQIYADAAAKMLETGTAMLQLGKAIEALNIEQGAGP